MYLFFLLVLFLCATPFCGSSMDHFETQDSDEVLKKIFKEYNEALEIQKQIINKNKHDDIKTHSESKVKMDPNIHNSFRSNSSSDIIVFKRLSNKIWTYVKSHVNTKILAGYLFDDDTDMNQNKFERNLQSQWWKNIELHNDDTQHKQKKEPKYTNNWHDDEYVVIDKVFTTSGFLVSVVVFIIFFFLCVRCCCMRSPSRILGTLSVLITCVILFHRLHEFFLIFSVDDVINAGDTLVRMFYSSGVANNTN